MIKKHLLKLHKLRLFFYITLYIIAQGCVSVKIPGTELTPSKNVQLEQPNPTLFSEIKVASSDKTWISKITGNTISYLSDCQKNSDPSLEQMQAEAFSVLENTKILQTAKVEYNSREAQTSLVEGTVDGVPIKMKILVFKKNGCNFTISFGGVKKNFDSELGEFELFQNKFKVN